MSETLEQFILRRRGELDQEAFILQTQLRVIEAEREMVDKVAMMYAAEPTPELPVAATGITISKHTFAGHSFAGHSFVGRSPKRVSEATIKELVLKILEEEQSGLVALDILPKINERAGIDYPRTSLSPQLSRLKAEGKIHREGRLWMLGGGPDLGIDIDQAETVDEDPRADYKTDEAPTEGAEAS